MNNEQRPKPYLGGGRYGKTTLGKMRRRVAKERRGPSILSRFAFMLAAAALAFSISNYFNLLEFKVEVANYSEVHTRNAMSLVDSVLDIAELIKELHGVDHRQKVEKMERDLFVPEDITEPKYNLYLPNGVN